MADKNKKIVYTLNALRGFAALMVVFSHIVDNGKFLDPGYLPQAFTYFHFDGHLMVLVFFVISGTVIQLSNRNPLRSDTIGVYLKKRLIRIYPIYAVSLIAALLVSKTIYSFYTVAGNFTFMHVLLCHVILENGPIWTLHYEVLFYLLFIPISLFAVDPLKVTIGAFLLGLANYFLNPVLHTTIITSYCFGFAFWTTGLVIANYLPRVSVPARDTTLLSFLLLLLTVPYFNQIGAYLYSFSMYVFKKPIEFSYNGDINYWFKIAFTIWDFSFLPFCFVAVVLFSERTFRFRKLVLTILYLVPAYTAYRIYHNAGHIDVMKYVFPLSCYGIGLWLFFVKWPFENLSRTIIKQLIWIGDISYGLYIIHGPIIFFFNRVTFFSGSGFTFLVRLFAYLILTFLAAYLLEIRFQKWVLSLVVRKRAMAVQ